MKSMKLCIYTVKFEIVGMSNPGDEM
jgi:hypothetical protein